jgi:hypothetical protein
MTEAEELMRLFWGGPGFARRAAGSLGVTERHVWRIVYGERRLTLRHLNIMLAIVPVRRRTIQLQHERAIVKAGKEAARQESLLIQCITRLPLAIVNARKAKSA